MNNMENSKKGSYPLQDLTNKLYLNLDEIPTREADCCTSVREQRKGILKKS